MFNGIGGVEAFILPRKAIPAAVRQTTLLQH
jgi:hypothetical protein